MRILLATPAFAPQVGGAETWTRAVFAALAARDHQVNVVARASRQVPGRHDVDGVAVERVDGGRARFARAVARAVATAAPDVVVAQYAALPVAVAAARRHGLPVVGVIHDVYGWKESRRIKGFVPGTVRWLALETSLRARRPDRVLVPSRATALQVERLLPGVAIDVVPAGADHLRQAHARRRVDGRVLFVGRLVSQKGVHDLIVAVATLRAEGRDVRLTVVGRGPEHTRLRALAARLDDAVTFREGINDAELDELLCTTAVLALPSTREGWGLAVTEAAARGTPYIAYDIPAVREQHELLRGGILVTARPAELAAGLRVLLDDPAGAETAAARAARVAAGLSWRHAAEVVETALADVVRARHNPDRR